MKTAIKLSSGERVSISEFETRDLGHGKQVRVFYSDGSDGYEHIEDLEITDKSIPEMTWEEILALPTENISNKKIAEFRRKTS
jgi:hypothetical protein